MGKIRKRKYQQRTLHVEAFGQEFELRKLSAPQWVALRRDGSDDDMLGIMLDAVVDSSLPAGAEIDVDEAKELLERWIAAHREAAVPNP